jgi:hypothetical protein
VSTLATATLEAAATSRSVAVEISRVGAELRRGVAELDLPTADDADAGYTITAGPSTRTTTALRSAASGTST